MIFSKYCTSKSNYILIFSEALLESETGETWENIFKTQIKVKIMEKLGQIKMDFLPEKLLIRPGKYNKYTFVPQEIHGNDICIEFDSSFSELEIKSVALTKKKLNLEKLELKKDKKYFLKMFNNLKFGFLFDITASKNSAHDSLTQIYCYETNYDEIKCEKLGFYILEKRFTKKRIFGSKSIAEFPLVFITTITRSSVLQDITINIVPDPNSLKITKRISVQNLTDFWVKIDPENTSLTVFLLSCEEGKIIVVEVDDYLKVDEISELKIWEIKSENLKLEKSFFYPISMT